MSSDDDVLPDSLSDDEQSDEFEEEEMEEEEEEEKEGFFADDVRSQATFDNETSCIGEGSG
jgi:hypothetical protein